MRRAFLFLFWLHALVGAGLCMWVGGVTEAPLLLDGLHPLLRGGRTLVAEIVDLTTFR